MSNEESQETDLSDRPTADQIRVTATYQRDEQTALTKSQFFDATTELQELLQWARDAEDMDVTLVHLEIELDDRAS